jgi:aldose 1-epimerase
MLEISHGGVALQIDESDGGRAVSWKIDGHEFMGVNSAHEIEYGMYPMAPWAGRIRENRFNWNAQAHSFSVNFDPWAIHGLVLTKQFTVIEHEPDRLMLEREFGADWPARGGVRCEWILDDEGLTTEMTCFSRSTEFPAVLGWHPWFRREVAGAQAAWTTDCAQMLLRGADSLPTGERESMGRELGKFDDVLTGGYHASIEWPGFARLDIENSQPWFVVFDQLPNFICVEPQTGPADGLSGLHAPITLVAPDQPLVMRTRWRVTRAQQPA